MLTSSLLLLSPALLLPQQGQPLTADPVTSLSGYLTGGGDYTAVDHGDFDGDGRLDAVVEAPGRDPLTLFAVAERQTIKQLPAAGPIAVQRLAANDMVVEAGATGLTQWSFVTGQGWSGKTLSNTPAERLVTREVPAVAGSVIWTIGPGGTSFQTLVCSFLNGGLVVSGPVVALAKSVNAVSPTDVDSDDSPELALTDINGLQVLDGLGEPVWQVPRGVAQSVEKQDRLVALQDLEGESLVWLESDASGEGLLHVWGGGSDYERISISGVGQGFLESSDVDGDGLADLVLHSKNADQVRVLLSLSGATRFKPASSSDLSLPASQLLSNSGGPQASATMADFDRDGDPDLLATAGDEFFFLRGTLVDHKTLHPGLNGESYAFISETPGVVGMELVLDAPTAELPAEVKFERLEWRAYYRASAAGEPVRSKAPVAQGETLTAEFPYTLSLDLPHAYDPIWYVEIDTWASVDGLNVSFKLPTQTFLVAPEHLSLLELEGLPGGTLWSIDLRSDHFGFAGNGTSGSSGIGHIPRLPPPALY